MHRSIPVVNKACAERARSRQQAQHRQRVRKIRPAVDTTVPTTSQLDHLRYDPKGEMILEERYREIDRENKILFQKMTNAMKQESRNTPRSKSGPQSLNRDARRTELMRIAQENRGLLKRIQRAQPVYSHAALEDEYRKSLSHLKNATEYPVVIRRKVSPSGLGSLTPTGQGGGDTPKSALPRPASAGNLGSGRHRVAGLDDLKYVLNEGRHIGEHYYLVEMATDGCTLAVCAYTREGGQNLELVVGELHHRTLYKECRGDYGAVADRLVVEGGALCIDTGKAVDRVYSQAPAERRQKTSNAEASSFGGRAGASRRPQSAAAAVGREARVHFLQADADQKPAAEPSDSRPNSSGRKHRNGGEAYELRVQEL